MSIDDGVPSRTSGSVNNKGLGHSGSSKHLIRIADRFVIQSIDFNVSPLFVLASSLRHVKEMVSVPRTRFLVLNITSQPNRPHFPTQKHTQNGNTLNFITIVLPQDQMESRFHRNVGSCHRTGVRQFFTSINEALVFN